MSRRGTTPTRGQGSRAMGVVSGHVVKLARESTGDSQERLAEALGVDVTTVQGWESGRRPLTALKAGDLVRLRMLLVKRGAPARLGRQLTDALEADLVLAAAIDAGASWNPHRLHPLGASVHWRALTNMITWPINGQRPAQLSGFGRSTRRGASPAHPVLWTEERTRLFDHLLTVAEQATGEGHQLLRRQATYLLGFDDRPNTAGWLDGEWKRATRRPADDLTGMMARRSAAVARAALGDDEPLSDFVATLDQQVDNIANLNYWAYWTGELPPEQHDDSFMVQVDPRSWAGLQMADHLTIRLDPASPQLALNLATLYSLVASRPALLTDWPHLRSVLRTRLDQVHACTDLARPIRQQVVGLAYAVRVADR